MCKTFCRMFECATGKRKNGKKEETEERRYNEI
jgi:hypothetical protein